MINLDLNKINYDYMGLFTTDDRWIHPASTESTYEIIYDEELSNASVLASDIFEWTRINVSRTLTVQKIADHFSYNPEYISKIINTHYGVTLKKLIDKIMIDKAKNYLNNTTLSIKEIAALLDFPSGNTFIKFYKYHENISPLKYRNLYFNTHMNKK